MKYKIKDRIIDDFLGEGTIIDIYSNLFFILFDVNPPFRYNLNENPTIRCSKTFKLKNNCYK